MNIIIIIIITTTVAMDSKLTMTLLDTLVIR